MLFPFLIICYILFFLGGSKQRKRLRTKITQEKKNLNELTELYNNLTSNSVIREDIEQGNFPWKDDCDDDRQNGECCVLCQSHTLF